MMQINDIRIGNLLHYYKPLEQEKQILRVNGIFFNEGCYWIQSNEYTDINENGVMGIPLTAEWLERCGFQQSEDLMFLQVGNTLYIEVDKQLNFYLNPETWRGQFVSPWVKIESVQQLQNLFFGLTGKELEIINA